MLLGFVLNSRLNDHRVVSLNETVGNEFAKSGQKRIGRLMRFDERDARRKMFWFRDPPVDRVRSTVRTKARCRPDQRGAHHSALSQKGEDFVVEEIVLGGSVLIEVYRDFLC